MARELSAKRLRPRAARTEGPANLLQGLRDYFGAHTYRRLDAEGSFHTRWAGRQGSPDPLAPCGRSFRRSGPICERSSILSWSIDATSIGRTRSCPRRLTIVGFRDVRSPGLVFPVHCRDAETKAGAFHQRPAVRGQLGLRRRRSFQFQSSPQMGTGSV